MKRRRVLEPRLYFCRNSEPPVGDSPAWPPAATQSDSLTLSLLHANARRRAA